MSVVLMFAAAGHVYALAGPSGGGYLWLTEMQEGLPSKNYYDPILHVLKLDENLQGVWEREFSPPIPDDYTSLGSYNWERGEICGPLTLYESSTADGYGKLLIGVYADNDPGGTMDVLRLEPQADCSLTMVKVHDGKADAGGFHTEGAMQVIYDKDGDWGTPKSIIIVGGVSPMGSRGVGYATDADSDGQFDGGSDTETYIDMTGCGLGDRFVYENYIWGGRHNDGGSLYQGAYSSYTSSLYYSSNSGSLSIPQQYQEGRRPRFLAAADTNGNDIPDVYHGLSQYYFDDDDNDQTPEVRDRGAIGHFEDLDGDNDALSANEHEIFWHGMTLHPDEEIWRDMRDVRVIAVVEADNGDLALICQARGSWRYGTTYFAVGIDDNGDWNGEDQIICSVGNGSGEPAPPMHAPGLEDCTYALWDPIPEPGTILLIGTGLLGLLGYVHRRRMK